MTERTFTLTINIAEVWIETQLELRLRQRFLNMERLEPEHISNLHISYLNIILSVVSLLDE